MDDRQNALITGGTRGIGRALAAELLAAGWRVFLCGRSEASTEGAVAALRASHGDQVGGRACDVRRQEEVESLVDAALEHGGRLDCLVNNAGVGHFAPVDEIGGDDWRRVIGTNLDGAFYATRAVVPIMRRQGAGWIFNIASLASRNPFPRGAAYNASKFGLLGFSDACMLDLRDSGIRVTAVLPGSVATDFAPPQDGAADDWKLTAEDVARTVVDALRYPTRALPSRIELRPTRTASS